MLNVIDSLSQLKGFPLAKWQIVKTELDIKKFGFPCWLKANIEGHKTEEKAVLRCKNLDDAQKNLITLRKKFPTQTVIVQEEIDGMPMILGLKEDKVFGKLLMIGFGGTFAETVRDVSFRALPIKKEEIEKQIRELKMYPALVSRKKYAVDKLVSLAEKFSNLEIREADLNPVILTEKDAVIVDSRILI